MSFLDAATGGMTGGVGALFGGGTSPSSAKSGDISGGQSSFFGDFLVGTNGVAGLRLSPLGQHGGLRFCGRVCERNYCQSCQ